MTSFVRFLIAFGLLITPFVILLILGGLWLWEQQLLIMWLGLSAAWAGLAWWWIVHLKQEYIKKYNPETNENTFPAYIPSNTATQVLWQDIMDMANTVKVEDYPIEDTNKLFILGQRVLSKVAHHYKPDSAHPVWDIPLPHLLKIIELVSADLQKYVAENIPMSHITSLSDVFQGYQWATSLGKYYNIYRVASFTFSPVAAVIRELKGIATEKIISSVSDEVKKKLLKMYVEKVGYYSIRLYSNTLILTEPSDFISNISRKDLNLPPIIVAEPLRVLVIGQVNAGKSSLINTLSNNVQAETNLLPTKQEEAVIPYQMLLADRLTLLLDTKGYDTVENAQQLAVQLTSQILNADVILLVCAANTAARSADKAILQCIHTIYQTDNSHALPPIIIALTQIDKLSPVKEWQPPYDLLNPENSKKAQMICAVIDVIKTELQDASTTIVPVNTHPERHYNIEEGLMPAILHHLPHAQEHQYLRCVDEYKKVEQQQLLMTQTKNVGQFFVDTLSGFVKKVNAFKKK